MKQRFSFEGKHKHNHNAWKTGSVRAEMFYKAPFTFSQKMLDHI